MKKIRILFEKNVLLERNTGKYVIYRDYKYKDLAEVLRLSKSYTENIEIITCKGLLKKHIKRIEDAGFAVKTVSKFADDDPVYQFVTLTI